MLVTATYRDDEHPGVRLWCLGDKFGYVIDGGRTLRVRCRSHRCRVDGLIPFHYFDLATGALLPYDDEHPQFKPVIDPTGAGATHPGDSRDGR
jgi:hypothetical protein